MSQTLRSRVLIRRTGPVFATVVLAAALAGCVHPVSVMGSKDYALVSTGDGGSRTPLAHGDLRRDGRQDLVVGGNAGVNVLLANGDGTYQAAVALDTSRAYYDVAVADVTGDGKQDIIATNNPANTVSILPGNGNGTFGTAKVITIAGATHAISLALGDLRNTGRQDIVVGTDSGVVPILNNGGGAFSTGASSPYLVGTTQVSVNDASLAVGDVAGNKMPIVVSGGIFHEGGGFCGSCSGIDVFPNTGGGTLGAAQYTAMGNDYETWPKVLFADVNGDSRQDLLTLNPGCGYSNSGALYVSLASGGSLGSVGAAQGPGCPTAYYTGPVDVATADFNGDGKTDIVSVAGAADGNGLLWTGNGDGTFTVTSIELPTAGFSRLIAVDVNNDQQTDVVATNGSTVRVVLLADQSKCVSSSSNLLSNPGFEKAPVGTGGAPQQPVTNGWFAVSRNSVAPTQGTDPVLCGSYAGQVLGGYWVHDLPLASDPNPPPVIFDPTKPFEFSLWFNPSALGSQFELVDNWDRGIGNSEQLLSVSLTAAVSGGYQTHPVVGPNTITGSPVVAANTWHHFDAITTGKGGSVAVKIDGVPLGPATLTAGASGARTTVLLGAVGGPNSSGSTNVSYDDVYLGTPQATHTVVTSSTNPVVVGKPVTYVASVSSNPDNSIGRGTISFSADGTPIAGCTQQPISSHTGTCTQTYASTGTHQISAKFNGDVGLAPSASPQLSQSIIAKPTPYSSTNWAGYIQTASVGTYMGITGTLTVPTLTGAKNPPCTITTEQSDLQKSSSWLGIGGTAPLNGFGDLIQAGVEADLAPDGCTQYYAWTDALSQDGGDKNTGLTIKPGDVITISVQETIPKNNTWDFTILTPRNPKFVRSVTGFTSHNASAEAILERTNGTNTGPQLPQTTNIAFDHVQFMTSANLSGQPFFVTPSGATLYDTDLINASGTSTGTATPSAWDSDGDGLQIADGTSPPPSPSS